ncbi:putative transcriptional regulator (Ypuh-like) [Primorskyibacter sedentarius]|uniref:Putative transcriptional regulator (Ypuh-like) n=1 Tax=Primorskyibacter sedentarius TaxID=745311 RepID=A0A4R3J0G0_9RHOB|nr:putative transcriptional regulator (Ypuh-like) [Primorskyibacter sedentarius]
MIGRLDARGLIGTGPRAPRRGAPYTYVTTDQFLMIFGLESLQELPERGRLEDAGVVSSV